MSLPIRPESILHPGLSNFDEKNNSDFSRNICKRRQYGPPRELVLDIIPDPGAVASPLITPSFPRHSHQAILSETNRDVQDFIDPLPTPELSSPSEALQDPLPKPPNSPPQSSISDLSMGSSSTLGFIQHATILKPRLAELQTPPPTPPPNLPLPPLPLPRAFLPNRASSLASVVISVDQDGRILQSMANTRKTGVYEARSLTQSTYRPRSKSSPLKPQPMPNKILEKKPSERRVRFMAPPPSFDFGSRNRSLSSSIYDDNSTIPIAPFECSYAPPPTSLNISKFEPVFIQQNQSERY